MTESSGPTQRRFQVRFSLLNLLLVVTVVCLAIAVWTVGRRAQDTENELRQLRIEAGYLTIDDREKLHAITIRETGARRWKWRVFLPAGYEPVVFTATNGIPRKGIGHGNRMLKVLNRSASGQEFILTVLVEQDYDGSKLLTVITPDGMTSKKLSPQESDWIKGVSFTNWDDFGSHLTIVRDTTEPIVLLRRCAISQKDIADPTQTYDGLMVWLAPDTKRDTDAP